MNRKNTFGTLIPGIVPLALLAVLAGSSTMTKSEQVTPTPIRVNTLSTFSSPAPTSTRPPTSTRDPRPTNTSIPTPTYPGTLTFTPTTIPTAKNPPTHSPDIELPRNLVLDEWELSKNTYRSRGSMEPMHATEEEILERYKGIDFHDNFPNPLIAAYRNKVMLNGNELVVMEDTVDSRSILHVFYDGDEICQVDAGSPYVRPNMWGLWTYYDHWIMEYVSVYEDPYGRRYTLGNIIWDGESLNSKLGYQESFGLTAIDGRILYFFRRNDKIGISYDGEEYALDYDSVLRYQCCEIGYYTNPRGLGTDLSRDQNLSFFAERNGIKYFVVLWAR